MLYLALGLLQTNYGGTFFCVFKSRASIEVA